MKRNYSKEDLTDRRFGNLIVLFKHKQSQNGGSSWVCRCDCGHVDIVQGYKLLNGSKTKCSFCNFGKYFFSDDFQTAVCELPNGNSFCIDFEDFGKVSQYKWSMTPDGYFKASLGSRKSGHILLHRLILTPPENLVVDHINGDRSNNCKGNLRICRQQQNTWNSGLSQNSISRIKGVSYDPRRGKWSARIYKERQINLGSFESQEEAARAYDEAARMLFGEFAKTNEMIMRTNRKETL